MDVPGWVLTATIWAYWIGVGAMIVRVRRHTRRVVGVVPEQRLERTMWLVWVPLVAAWAALPWLALHRAGPPWGLPGFAQGEGYAALRWVAAAVAAGCLAATVRCWARMGKDWRMAVTSEENQALITDGMFSRVRHPIYALSITLMLCSVVILPKLPMAVTAGVHIALMIAKARSEEQHLLALHGESYARNIARTWRFEQRRATIEE